MKSHYPKISGTRLSLYSLPIMIALSGGINAKGLEDSPYCQKINTILTNGETVDLSFGGRPSTIHNSIKYFQTWAGDHLTLTNKSNNKTVSITENSGSCSADLSKK